MEKRMSDYLRFLNNEIQKIEKEMSSFPPGKLICAKDGKHTKWYLSENGKHRYIYKSERKFAEQMARKRYLQDELEALYKEQKAVKHYLNHNVNFLEVKTNFYSKHSNYLELLVNTIPEKSDYAKEWMNSEFHQNQYKLEKKIFRSDDGTMVRSKSEAIIASKLYHANIPYRYECELVLVNKIYYPDFTILKPKTNELVYHEHCGMMDDYHYVDQFLEKVGNYAQSGIYLGQNLTVTLETEDAPLRLQDVDNLIERLQDY